MKSFLPIVILVFGCCGIQTKMSYKPDNNFNWEGHRGARGLMPENTIAAMQKALDFGVATLEIDVMITKDKQVVVTHDPFFHHDFSIKPNGEFVTAAEERKLNIYEMNYDEVRRYDVGLKPHPGFPLQQKIAAYKPLLSELNKKSDEYSRKTNRAFPVYNIELKADKSSDNIFHPEPKQYVDLVVAEIKKSNIEGRYYLQSFDKRVMLYIHKTYPKITTAILVGGEKKSLQSHLDELGYTPNIFSPHYSIVNEELVKKVKALNMKLIPWTVNDVPTMKKLIALGVDGIITDFPNMIREAEAK